MQRFQTYPLSPISILRKTGQRHVDDDIILSQIISNDSDISYDDKKYFCENTAWTWHGEFGRLIMATTLTHNIDLFDDAIR